MSLPTKNSIKKQMNYEPLTMMALRITVEWEDKAYGVEA